MNTQKLIKFIFPIIFIISFTYCDGSKKVESKVEKVPTTIIEPLEEENEEDNEKYIDLTKSIGILNLIEEFEFRNNYIIYNMDGSRYAKLDLDNFTIEFNNKIIGIDSFSRNDKLKNYYQFNPFNFYIEPDVINFSVKEIIQDTAIVYINKDSGLLKKIKLEKQKFQFETWKQHLVGKYINIRDKDNAIRSKDNLNSKILLPANKIGKYGYRIYKIVGNWAYIKCINDGCEVDCGKSAVPAWIYWKKKGKLAIKLYYDC